MYYSKSNYYIIVFGCVCISVFLAFVFIKPQGDNKDTNITTSQVMDKDVAKEPTDELSRKLVTIREELRKQEERERTANVAKHIRN